MNYKPSPSDSPFTYNGYRPFFMVGSILLLMLVIAGCTTSSNTTHVDIETLDKGESSGIETKEQIAIESQNSWEALWANHMAVRTPTPSIPQVDFSQETVIAIFSGWKPTGGYSTEITAIELADDAVNVYYRETSPEAETQPFHIVKIGMIGISSVTFIEKE